jgi:hypothetical protein
MYWFGDIEYARALARVCRRPAAAALSAVGWGRSSRLSADERRLSMT